MIELTDSILKERLVDVSEVNFEEAVKLRQKLDGRFKKCGGKTFIVYIPSEMEKCP